MKREYWRNTDNQKNTPAVAAEFSLGQSEISGLQRRDMLKLMGASLGLSGVGISCRRGVDHIMPYAKHQDGIIPGIPNFFATSYSRCGMGGVGVLVESHEGRPTKVEGNPSHPASLGKADLLTQASVLQLYDPDRSKVVINNQTKNSISSWSKFKKKFAELSSTNQKIAILRSSNRSVAFDHVLTKFNKKFKGTQIYYHDSAVWSNDKKAFKHIFNKNLSCKYRMENCRVIVSVNDDFLMNGEQSLANANAFAKNRKIMSAGDAAKMNRLYVVESGFSVTGANADNRLILPKSSSVDFLGALALELFNNHKLAMPCPKIMDGTKIRQLLVEQFSKTNSSVENNFIKSVAKDLIKNKGKSLITVGKDLDSSLHSIALILNIALQNLDKTFALQKDESKYIAADKNSKNLKDLISDIKSNKIDTLIILDGNPCYSSSGGENFTKYLQQVKNKIHLGLYVDETAINCDWHLPATHYLESWGDCVSFDGTVSMIQPLIAPLHDGKSDLELLALMADLDKQNGYDLLKQVWSNLSNAKWRRVLHDGVLPGSGFNNYKLEKISFSKVKNIVDDIARLQKNTKIKLNKDNLELCFAKDYSVDNGDFANLSWLQELPDPMTKLTWDNALLISPAFAKELGLKNKSYQQIYKSQVVEINVDGKSIKVPTFVMPGIAKYSIHIALGYGRQKAGYVGNGVGVDAYKILPNNGQSFTAKAKVTKTDTIVELACTQEQFAVNGSVLQETDTLTLANRWPTRQANLSKYENKPDYAKDKGISDNLLEQDSGEAEAQPIQMTKAFTYNGNKWGMNIDLTSCIGCNACVVACQAENNIPSVGKEQVKKGRIMHWIRMDRYYSGDVNNPQAVQQPVTCMQCENAPCEPVCPVAATVHDKEGLNTMVYNRCVGTRYCANNCPYKVRRFNFFDFSNSGDLYVAPFYAKRQELLKMQKNPDVSIRYRGVMEKCTYCTQRIQEAKIKASRQGKNQDNLKDGDVIPACAQTCPTEAITFGNLNDANSKVSKMRLVDRDYVMLEELNTRPRTSYLAKIRNPNSELL